MKEPWETLLGQFRHHWFLHEFLEDDTPHLKAILDDERYWSLSSGEQAMVLCADAILRINQAWLAVDGANRMRIDLALRLAVDA